MHFPLAGNITFFNIQQFLPSPLSQIRQTPHPPQIQQVNYTMLLTQITYTVLYKHSALLSHCLCFHIIPPNVCICYKDYFHLRPIYSYTSTCSLLWWPRAVLHKVILTLWRGIWWSRAVLHKVIMTLGFTLSHTDIQAFLNSPWQKNEKNINLHREKVFRKACKSAHRGFWVYWLQCTMLELCVTSIFWVIMVFFIFYWKV